MRRRGGGSVVNMSSVQGLRGFKGWAAYAAAKGGVAALTVQAAVDLPALAAPVILTWLVLSRVARLWAVPAALVVAVVAVLLVAINLLVEAAGRWLDPRLRAGAAG